MPNGFSNASKALYLTSAYRLPTLFRAAKPAER